MHALGRIARLATGFNSDPKIGIGAQGAIARSRAMREEPGAMSASGRSHRCPQEAECPLLTIRVLKLPVLSRPKAATPAPTPRSSTIRKCAAVANSTISPNKIRLAPSGICRIVSSVVSTVRIRAPSRAAAKAIGGGQVEGKLASEVPPRLKSQYPGFHFSFALDFDSAARLEDELVLELFVDGARHLNRIGNSARLHAARQVHCVTP